MKQSVQRQIFRLAHSARRHFIWLASAVALLFVMALVYASDRVVRDQITRESQDHAVRTARLLADSSYEPALRAMKGVTRLPRAVHAQLDSATRAGIRSGAIVSATIWRPDGLILYSERPQLLGRRLPLAPEIQGALAGRTLSSLESGARSPTEVADKRIDVTVPLRARGGAKPVGALELASPYSSIATDIHQRTQRLDRIVLGAGAILYLLMLPLLVWASRVLRSAVDPHRLAMVKALRLALERDELSLELQPLVDLRTGAVKSAEALIRWDHPTRGRIPPDAFIPVVEGSPFFWDFTLHVLDMALADCADWHRRGLKLAVAVNVSSGNLLDTRLPNELRHLLAKHRLPPTALELEVTEGAIMDEADRAAQVLGELAEVGIGRVAIDDFGTGYSSLARVRALPIDALKIDRSFIAEMDATGDSAMVRSVIALAHNLGLLVVAEGIESDETWGRLARLGCDLGQGYGIARPLTPDGLAVWLRERQIQPAHWADDDDRRRGPGRRRNDYFAVAFDNAPEAMMIADDAGRWVDANLAACDLLAVTRETLRLRRWGAFSDEGSKADLDRIWSSLIEGGHTIGHWTLKSGDHRAVAVEYEATANFLPGLHLFVLRPQALVGSEPITPDAPGRAPRDDDRLG